MARGQERVMLCVVSHDAGGAEVIASYIARKGLDCRHVLEGPAIAVFRRRLGSIATIDLETALETCDEFLCGTSWQSDLEWRAVVAAKAAGKTCRSFIDHWGHYRERFTRNGREVLPDELWLGDRLGVQLATPIFPGIPIRLVPNPYFQDIREHLEMLEAEAAPASGLRVLFVCEPLSEHGLIQYGNALHWGYTEFDALRYFFEHRDALGGTIEQFVIRPHPSEQPHKYDEIAREFGSKTKVGGAKGLLEEIAACDVVVGCESMAMVVGLVAGRRVIAAIPPGGNPCSLPHKEIESLQALIENDDSGDLPRRY